MEISQDEQIFTSIKTIDQSLKDDNIFIERVPSLLTDIIVKRAVKFWIRFNLLK